MRATDTSLAQVGKFRFVLFCFIIQGIYLLSTTGSVLGANMGDFLSDWATFIYDVSPPLTIEETLPILVKEWPGGFWQRDIENARLGFAKVQTAGDVRMAAGINRLYFEKLAYTQEGGIIGDKDDKFDNQCFYYYAPSGYTVRNARKATYFWEWFQNHPQEVLTNLGTASGWTRLLDLASKYSVEKTLENRPNVFEFHAASPAKASAPNLEVWFPRPLPTSLPMLAGKPSKVPEWRRFSAVDLARGRFTPAEDAALRQLAKFSKYHVENQDSPVGKLPPYNPDSKTAQPGDIFVRRGPRPHGGNYWGLTKVGELHYDSIELSRDSKDETYVVPMHWTADPGPYLNFYRPLESDIPCIYKGRRITLKNLPIDVKEGVREGAYRFDHARLGSSHGKYDLVGVFAPSNQCIDSLLEPWGVAFKKSGVKIINNGGKPVQFREHFLLLNTANPTSRPSFLGQGALGAKMPRVEPPRWSGDSIVDQVKRSYTSMNEGGVSMYMEVSEKSFLLQMDEELEALREIIIKKRPSPNTLTWPVPQREKTDGSKE